MEPTLSTGTGPKRSAIAPASGCAAPHSSAWIASASANTSRPQPLAFDIGERKKPNAERGPKPSMLIAQPHARMPPGVRQEMCLAIVAAWELKAVSPYQAASRRDDAW